MISYTQHACAHSHYSTACPVSSGCRGISHYASMLATSRASKDQACGLWVNWISFLHLSKGHQRQCYTSAMFQNFSIGSISPPFLPPHTLSPDLPCPHPHCISQCFSLTSSERFTAPRKASHLSCVAATVECQLAAQCSDLRLPAGNHTPEGGGRKGERG